MVFVNLWESANLYLVTFIVAKITISQTNFFSYFSHLKHLLRISQAFEKLQSAD